MSQKYVIAHFITPLEPKYNFSYKRWPLHVTLLPIFAINNSLDELTNNLNKISHSITPFSIQIGDDDNFGPNGEILVSLIEPTADILKLHDLLHSIAESYEFNTPQYIGKGYRPHATKQANNQLVTGKRYLIDSMTLVDMYPNNDITRREIIKTFYFN